MRRLFDTGPIRLFNEVSLAMCMNRGIPGLKLSGFVLACNAALQSLLLHCRSYWQACRREIMEQLHANDAIDTIGGCSACPSMATSATCWSTSRKSIRS